mgnify:CR=1 FL=1
MGLLIGWTTVWFILGAVAFIGIKIFAHRNNRDTMGKMFKKDAWDD